MPQKPVDLAGAEVGVEQQPGPSPPLRFQPLSFPVLTEVGGASVLPDEGGSTGSAVTALPENCCFALIGYSAGSHGLALFRGEAGLEIGHGLALAVPDRGRVLFDPTIGWIVDLQRG